MLRFANYVFGTEIESNSDSENIDINQCTEQDIDDDWILIDVYSGEDQKPTNGQELSNTAVFETTTNKVPQNLNAAEAQVKSRHSEEHKEPTGQSGVNGGPAMEDSWFVTPPPCFNSLSHPVIIETTPLENLLIEHPSMSVFGPSLPPIDHRTSHRNPDSSNRSSADTNVSTPSQSRRQLRRLQRQENAVHHRSDNHAVNSHLHLPSGEHHFHLSHFHFISMEHFLTFHGLQLFWMS